MNAWLRAASACCLLLCVVWPGMGTARAASLAKAQAGTLPPLPTGVRVLGSTLAGDAPALLAQDGRWTVSDDGTRWRRAGWAVAPPPDTALAMQSPVPMGLAMQGKAFRAVVLRADANGEAWRVGAAMPVAVRAPVVAALGGLLYVLGQDAGNAMRFLRYDPATDRWAALAPPAGAEVATTLVAQGNELFAGVPAARAGDRMLRWSDAAGWREAGTAPGPLQPGAARALGQAHLLYLVGAGATRVPMTFQTITGAWATLPGARVPATSRVLAWTDGYAWLDAPQPPAAPGTPVPSASGTGGDAAHAAAAAGAARIATFAVQSPKFLLTWLDWLVIVVYLAGMIGIGLYFYLREKRTSTANFFLGNRTIPFWAAGLSLYAVNTSSISFIAIPAKAFETNWQYLTNNLVAVLGLVFVAIWVVPMLRRLDLMSTFSYLETRFHPAIRMLASALAILIQIGSRMSVILFLPALAISTIIGLPVTWSIWLMGGFTIVYTAMGGMKAVIWTDVVQVIVKMGGAVFAIVFIAWSLTGGLDGFGEMARIAAAQDKTKLFDFSFDLTKATVWGFIFLVLFEVVLTFPKDQVLMQRVLSTPDARAASRSIWAFAAIMIPGGFVFYGIGTALFAYYQTNPERMNPLLPIDATFPLFIAAELPMGVTGLIIAGIFAAAMATLSGIMNSVATLVSVDFYERFARDKSQKKGVFFAEVMTVVVGLVGIGAALVLSKFDVRSLFDVSIELAGLLGGGFAGAYTLGMFTRRANSAGVAIGIAAAIVITFVAWLNDLVHPYFYLAISILSCIVVGYLASLCFPAPTRDLTGLTIYRDTP